MRGRKPKPLEQRRAEGGDVSHRPLPEPLLISGRPDLAHLQEPPDDVGEFGAQWWVEVIPQLVNVGMIDKVDEGALWMLARTWDEYAKADAVVAEEGFFGAGSGGQIKEHPAVKIRARARADYFKYAEQFGLTPMARTRFGLMELNRRSLADEMNKVLGGDEPTANNTAVISDAEVVEDGDVGLPGV